MRELPCKPHPADGVLSWFYLRAYGFAMFAARGSGGKSRDQHGARPQFDDLCEACGTRRTDLRDARPRRRGDIVRQDEGWTPANDLVEKALPGTGRLRSCFGQELISAQLCGQLAPWGSSPLLSFAPGRESWITSLPSRRDPLFILSS